MKYILIISLPPTETETLKGSVTRFHHKLIKVLNLGLSDSKICGGHHNPTLIQ